MVADSPPGNLGPVDNDCHVAWPTVTYQYRTTAGEWADLPDCPVPDDLATTTTTTGDTVPYIVRFERGRINRAVYEIALLHQPGMPLPDSWTATPGWNDRLATGTSSSTNVDWPAVCPAHIPAASR